MKVSVRAEHILSPSLRPSAISRATELCLDLPETFLSLQGDLTKVSQAAAGRNLWIDEENIQENIQSTYHVRQWATVNQRPH